MVSRCYSSKYVPGCPTSRRTRSATITTHFPRATFCGHKEAWTNVRLCVPIPGRGTLVETTLYLLLSMFGWTVENISSEHGRRIIPYYCVHVDASPFRPTACPCHVEFGCASGCVPARRSVCAALVQVPSPGYQVSQFKLSLNVTH